MLSGFSYKACIFSSCYVVVNGCGLKFSLHQVIKKYFYHQVANNKKQVEVQMIQVNLHDTLIYEIGLL